MSSSTLRRWTWIALLAIWASVCAPVLAQTVAGDPVPDLCSSDPSGAAEVRAAIGGLDTPDTPPIHKAGAVCGYCLLQAHVPALTSTGASSSPLRRPQPALVPWAAGQPRPTVPPPGWTTPAPSRAPPSL